ncbi:hypothetical protein B0H14DRAFT_3484874 [Mycena olivaceomarginata]|nr:hypothetical protein B0H14DRAFT_3484874 [Mycena olivaceomarginata]
MHKEKALAAARKGIEFTGSFESFQLDPRKPAKVDALEAALRLYFASRDKYPLPNDPEADMDPDALTVALDIVDDWVADEDAEMEE